jgi:hypothetical protein
MHVLWFSSFFHPFIHPLYIQWNVRQIVLAFLGRQYAVRMSALEAANAGPADRKEEEAAAEFARLVVRTFLIDDNTQR